MNKFSVGGFFCLIWAGWCHIFHFLQLVFLNLSSFCLLAPTVLLWGFLPDLVTDHWRGNQNFGVVGPWGSWDRFVFRLLGHE